MTKESAFKVCIVGGGVSALSAAHYLEKLAKQLGFNLELTIFEQEANTGGKIQSTQTHGFLVEYGPDSIATRQSAVMDLVNEVGLSQEVIAPSLRSFSILKDGKLQKVDLSLLSPFPNNIKALFRSELVSFAGKLRACIGGALSFLTADKIFISEDDQDIASFFRAKWGLEMSRNLLEPLFSGLYGGDLTKISKSVIHAPSSHKANAKVPPYIGFKNGISSINNAIKNQLKCTTFCLSEPVISVAKSSTAIKLKTIKDNFEFDACLLTTPAHATQKLLAGSLPEANAILTNFQASDAAIVSLGFSDYQASAEVLDLAGSGVIIPVAESEFIRGITLSSRKWINRAPDGALLVRVFGREGVFEGLSEQNAIELAKTELERILNIKGTLIYSGLHTWKLGSALCGVGHKALVDSLKERIKSIPGLFVAGACYGGIGIGDCIESAQKVAREIVDYVKLKREDALIGAAIQAADSKAVGETTSDSRSESLQGT